MARANENGRRESQRGSASLSLNETILVGKLKVAVVRCLLVVGFDLFGVREA